MANKDLTSMLNDAARRAEAEAEPEDLRDQLADAARRAEATAATINERNAQMQQRTTARAAQFPAIIGDLVERAKQAQPYRIRNVGDDERGDGQFIKQPAAAAISALMGGISLPSLFDKDGRLNRNPAAFDAGRSVTLDAGVAMLSRTAQAGAHVVIYSDAAKAHAIGKGIGDVALERKPSALRLVSAAPFAVLDVDSNAEVSDIPLADIVASAPIEFDGPSVVTKAVAFTIPRSEKRIAGAEFLADEIAIALALGLARAADEVLFDALTAANLGNFSLAAAAAADVRFNELRALVGTAGTGASINAAGQFVAAGVPAELTADTAGTFVGAWDRAGIAIHENLSLTAKKVRRDGAVEVVCIASFIPVVPASGALFKVAA